MINNWRYLLFILIFIINSKAFSQNLVVDITEGNVDPLPIALQKFVSDINSKDISDNIIRVISNDLSSTGLFVIVDFSAQNLAKANSVKPDLAVGNAGDPVCAVTRLVGFSGDGLSNHPRYDFSWDRGSIASHILFGFL